MSEAKSEKVVFDSKGMESHVPLVTHAEFMEIFWFCDRQTPEEIKAMDGMSDEEFDEKSPIARRLTILSKIHEVLFGIPTKGCRIVEEPVARAKGKKSVRTKKKEE